MFETLSVWTGNIDSRERLADLVFMLALQCVDIYNLYKFSSANLRAGCRTLR
mgnify:CR=1 FL=1